MGRNQVQKTQLLQAFWTLIETAPETPIKVLDLTRAAGCYRGTFYYHFADIDDFLNVAVSEFVQIELAAVMREVLTEAIVLSRTPKSAQMPTNGQPRTGEAAPSPRLQLANSDLDRRLRRLGVLLNSSVGAQLQSKIIELIVESWRESFGIDLKEGTPHRGIAQFVIGGGLALWAWRARQEEPIRIEHLITPPLVASIANLISAVTEPPPQSVRTCEDA